MPRFPNLVTRRIGGNVLLSADDMIVELCWSNRINRGRIFLIYRERVKKSLGWNFAGNAVTTRGKEGGGNIFDTKYRDHLIYVWNIC
jgi:hypothetical protein